MYSKKISAATEGTAKAFWFLVCSIVQWKITSCTCLWVTLKFTIEVSIYNNKDPARVSMNAANFKLKVEFIIVKESMEFLH